MKKIQVVAAIITDSQGQILATQRGSGEFHGMWEFPGGKIEVGEEPVQALRREILEELDVVVSVGEFIMTVEYAYPKFYLTMHCYRCTIESGNLTLLEHSSCKWLSVGELDSVEWLPADKPILNRLRVL